MSTTRQKLLQELARTGRQQSTHTVLMHYAIAAKLGLNPADHKCLDFIIESNGVTAGDIQRLTGLTSGAVTAMVDRLVKRGFVMRHVDEQDRRKIIILPRLERLADIEEMFRPMMKSWATVLEQFTDNELEIVLRYQDALLGAQRRFTP
jgi:DNA-binding MarR family transcriptional regulator